MPDSPISHPLAHAFLRGACREAASARLDALEAGLQALLEHAERTHPAIDLDPVEYAVFLGERYAPDELPEPERGADCFLACGCGRARPGALETFDSRYGGLLRRALGKLRLAPDEVQEALAKVRRELFVTEPGRAPRIASYQGKGDLRGWIRITAIRSAMKMFRGGAREVLVEDYEMAGPARSTIDPELDYLKAKYRPAFAQAFRDALGALAPSERGLLRQHTIDGLSIDKLAQVHQIHRATVARRLQRTRERLLEDTKMRLAESADLSVTECDSIVRLVRSRLDETVRSWFAETG